MTLHDTLAGIIEKTPSVCIAFDFGTATTPRKIEDMTNEENQAFALAVVRLIMGAASRDETERDEARQELIDVFGPEVVDCPAVAKNDERVCYTLTANGLQFRVWHSPFGTVTNDHFDSCGRGLIMEATCSNAGVLREWIHPFIERMILWESDYGKLWIGGTLRRW